MSAYVIPQRCGPQQLPATYGYQLQAVKKVYERITKHTSVSQCNRCGESTFLNHLCKALSRLCFICRNYGHYAKCCIFAPRPLAGTSVNLVAVTSKQPKSQKKQERDRNRYVKFIERKSVCMEMPYYPLGNEELKQCVPKFQCSNLHDFKVKKLEKACVSYISDIQELSAKTKSLQEAVSYEQKRRRKTETNLLMAEHEVSHLKNVQTCKAAEHRQLQSISRDKIQALQNENEQLQSKVNSLQKQLLQNNSTVEKLQRQVQDQQTKFKQQETECMKLKTQNSELNAKVQNIKRSQKRIQNENRRQKKELNSRESEINELIFIKGKLEHAIEGFSIAITSCRREISRICEVFEFHTSSLDDKNMKLDKTGFHCDKCGSTFFHESCTSSYLGTPCGLCHQLGHYTAYCTRISELIE